MIKYYLIFFGILTMGCKIESKSNKNCIVEYENYIESLRYLERYFNTPNNGTEFLLSDIEANISVLESESGIKSEVGGELLGKFRIKATDIVKWKNWLLEKCPEYK